MDDLVKRLQDYLDCRPWAAGRTFDPTHPECLIAQAKDRIEQLEAALREILSNNPIRGDTGSSTLKEIVEATLKSSVIARAALGEKK